MYRARDTGRKEEEHHGADKARRRAEEPEPRRRHPEHRWRSSRSCCGLLAQEVKELNERQKAARRENTPDPGMMKGLKEATAVLKDLAGVVKTLNDQGTELEGTECGVVLLPPVEQEEKA